MKFWIYVLIDIIFQLTNSYFITCIIFWVINHFSFFLLKTKVPHKSWNNGRNFPKIGIKPFFGIIFIHWKNKVNCITGRYLTWLPLHDVLACYIPGGSKKKTRVWEAVFQQPFDQLLIPLAYIKNNISTNISVNFRLTW